MQKLICSILVFALLSGSWVVLAEKEQEKPAEPNGCTELVLLASVTAETQFSNIENYLKDRKQVVTQDELHDVYCAVMHGSHDGNVLRLVHETNNYKWKKGCRFPCLNVASKDLQDTVMAMVKREKDSSASSSSSSEQTK